MKKLLLLLMLTTPAFAEEAFVLIEHKTTVCFRKDDPDCMTELQKKAALAEQQVKASLGRGCTEQYWNWKTLSYMERAVECEK